jgi:hypothetical protein
VFLLHRPSCEAVGPSTTRKLLRGHALGKPLSVSAAVLVALLARQRLLPAHCRSVSIVGGQNDAEMEGEIVDS